ncbi:hypothetical protein EGR_09556 [Echinococcus granulosus]|uniref:Uncharacterized protein n=1 Tax=Echinococcus granulosus TaxID=6210 RepID=W6UAT0_ECHGR|nr:hypothetical protein EGR_09556 [Echinococcus granulosus]EUB55577.1 hypothetical protein EGR_09556 [Echinococcus granulosus]
MLVIPAMQYNLRALRNVLTRQVNLFYTSLTSTLRVGMNGKSSQLKNMIKSHLLSKKGIFVEILKISALCPLQLRWAINEPKGEQAFVIQGRRINLKSGSPKVLLHLQLFSDKVDSFLLHSFSVFISLLLGGQPFIKVMWSLWIQKKETCIHVEITESPNMGNLSYKTSNLPFLELMAHLS